QEALAGRDFSTFTPDQLDEVYRLTVQIARRLARRLSRRRRPVGRRGRIDLRRTLRANLNRGDLIDLTFRRPQRRKVRLRLLRDGWDTGEPDVLATELLRIKRRAGRLVWLNPLLGNPSYEPLTRGMAAALPLVDDFAAAHNLTALRELAHRLTL